METVLWLDAHRGVAIGIGAMMGIDRLGGVGTSAKGIIGAGKGLFRGGNALRQGAGLAEAGKAMLGIGGTAAGTASTAAALGVSGAALGAGAIGLAGLAGAGAIIAYREEIAKWMFSERNDDPARRGLGPATPTQALANLQNANGRAPTTNNVRFESSINIDGANHDPNEIARNVSDQQRGMMEQFFQSQALEQGAAG
jgi:hypothetical protein